MSRLSRNLIYNLTGQISLVLLGLVAVKFIYKQLGAEALGIIYFTLMVNSLMTVVFSMGISSAVVREVSANHEKNPSYVRELIRTGSFIFWSGYVVIAIGIYILAPYIVEKWINISSLDKQTAIYAMRVLGISTMLGFPEALYSSILRGLQRMEYSNFIVVFNTALQQAGTVTILAFEGSFVAVAYWFAICYTTRILMEQIAITRFYPVEVLVPGLNTDVIRNNLAFSSKMLIISINATIHSQAERLIISKIMPASMIGYYGVLYGNISKSRLLTTSISNAAYPSLTEIHSRGDYNSLMLQYTKLQDLICFGAIPFFAAIPFAILPVFSFIINSDVARMLLLPATLLCFGFYMNATLTIPHIITLAKGEPGIMARQGAIAMALLPLRYYVIVWFGLVGAGLSWLAHNLFHYIFTVPIICRRCLGIKTSQWFSRIILVAVLTLATYGVAWTCVAIGDKLTLTYLSLSYVLASTFYLTGAYFIIDKDLRRSITHHIGKMKAIFNCWGALDAKK